MRRPGYSFASHERPARGAAGSRGALEDEPLRGIGELDPETVELTVQLQADLLLDVHVAVVVRAEDVVHRLEVERAGAVVGEVAAVEAVAFR